MRYLSLADVLELHRRLLVASGGADGMRDPGAVESAISQPHATFAGEDLYPDLVAEASALCHSLVMNRSFVDGNKRVGHAAMEVFLLLNGHEVACDVDEQERVMLQLAAGDLSRAAFTEWLREHTVALSTSSTGLNEPPC